MNLITAYISRCVISIAMFPMLPLLGFSNACLALPNTGLSRVSVCESGSQICAEGLTFTSAPVPEAYVTIPGPLPRVPGFKAAGTPVQLRGKLAATIKDAGSLAFWFATDRDYKSGDRAPVIKQKLVEITGTLDIVFISEPSSITLLVEWAGPRSEMFSRHIRIILPRLPGPAWHHFAVNWNGQSGEINAFLNGTPYYVPGERVAPFSLQFGREFAIHLERFALADVRIDYTPLSPGTLASMVPASYYGGLDNLLGAAETGTLSSDGLRDKLLYARDLSAAAQIGDWILEGPGEITHRAGWMEMKSTHPDSDKGHIVHWCPEIFPDRFVAEWDFELLNPKGLCILFFAARGSAGQDLFSPNLASRNGIFKQYTNGDIDCYHISYFANAPDSPRSVANLRKNRGFYLIANGSVGVPVPRPGQIHHALLIKDGSHIRMAIDGRIIIDYVDDGERAGPVLSAGRIGFRQMQWTAARYRDFQVHTLK